MIFNKPESRILHRLQIPRWTIILLFFLSVHIAGSYAQEISARAMAPQKEYLVGDKINILIELKMPAGFTLEWLKHEPDPTRLEQTDSASTDTVEAGHFKNVKINVHVSGYDSGQAIYPAQEFAFRKKGDQKPFIIKTDPINLLIKTISVANQKDIKPIVDPVDPGIDFLKTGRYFIIYFLLLVVIIVVIIYVNRSKNGGKGYIEPAPYIRKQPWEKAVDDLHKLENEKLIDADQIKEHYISLANIMRQYISAIYRIDAMEITSSEIMEKLKSRMISMEDLEKLSWLFSLADSVKFAKYSPVEEDHQNAMAVAVALISAMRPEPAQQ